MGVDDNHCEVAYHSAKRRRGLGTRETRIVVAYTALLAISDAPPAFIPHSGRQAPVPGQGFGGTEAHRALWTMMVGGTSGNGKERLRDDSVSRVGSPRIPETGAICKAGVYSVYSSVKLRSTKQLELHHLVGDATGIMPVYSVNPSVKLRPRSQSNGIYNTSSVMQPASCRFRRELVSGKAPHHTPPPDVVSATLMSAQSHAAYSRS